MQEPNKQQNAAEQAARALNEHVAAAPDSASPDFDAWSERQMELVQAYLQALADEQAQESAS